MPINYDLTNIKDHETICWREMPDGKYRMDAVLETLIMLMPVISYHVDPGCLTARNLPAIAMRLLAAQGVNGALLKDTEGKEHCITPAMLAPFVGLKTNATSYVTDGELMKQWTQSVKERLREGR